MKYRLMLMAKLYDVPAKEIELVLIDLQKGITAIPTDPYSSKEVIENARKLKAAFRQDALVILINVCSSPDGKDMLHPE